MIPVAYGDGVADRIRAAAPAGVDAFVDTHGGEYVELTLLIGVAAGRINTIADFGAAARYGVKTNGGAEAGPGAQVLAELAGLTPLPHALALAVTRSRRCGVTCPRSTMASWTGTRRGEDLADDLVRRTGVNAVRS